MASLPEELQPEIQRMMVALRKEIPTTSGKIYQIALAALDKLCEYQNMFKQMQKRSQKLKGACNKSYLQIKCKDRDSCECKTKKKQHFRKSGQSFQSKSTFPRRRKGRRRYFKRRNFRSKKTNKFFKRLGLVAMASQSSRSSRATRRTASKQRRTILCHHGEPPVLRVSAAKENSERRFWGCVHYKVGNECMFFHWADQEHAEEDPEKVKLRNKVLKLKSMLKAIEGKLKIATFVGLLGWL
ncbi:hypothetical protein PIB30_058405 [Stylosanthes scabra]|uniref:GRF-type domain-containing protein n=1 Tax=Stylosanthes scabra TaxID=79078 RepID=A0ABU6RJX5_9FABA|nr:hypothetical protein [Stylosanthes scabra]